MITGTILRSLIINRAKKEESNDATTSRRNGNEEFGNYEYVSGND